MNFDELLPSVPTSWNNRRVHFFKYMNFSTAKAVLTNGSLRWSTFGTLHDPYDMQFDLAITADRAKLKEASLAKLWEVYKGERDVGKGNIPVFCKIRRVEVGVNEAVDCSAYRPER
ncbi:hypothetical protein [Mesorhizobium sp.]|uniref:hypothetical protein n=1 Tax=Mesorhizobium sp. TaxID=1871066 RepID=UPI000FD3D2BB|nr:hypothetical protein [Mesorhizobium sp.]RVC64112.1 hypothetical protein EN779_02835 [Mesorhizobium sp. M4B.F.Ca.ET.088.02.2.1]RWA60522.1 MAG: hypothetical protein EOQ27_21605 [Mesorhizobium sp.]RWC97309.1 MAG: hypothetical protein EOS32_04510 [Mesorhizobium sp.]RWF31923.1 MAG: hypothetical protein EOS45_08985 [Mesorhizobium sp.]RWF43271.1 MAG: hypothetical protein EOS65_06035 [Mesorhizobium sp.]